MIPMAQELVALRAVYGRHSRPGQKLNVAFEEVVKVDCQARRIQHTEIGQVPNGADTWDGPALEIHTAGLQKAAEGAFPFSEEVGLLLGLGDVGGKKAVLCGREAKTLFIDAGRSGMG